MWSTEGEDHSGLVIIGGGGHARVIAEAAKACEIRLAGFLDDDAHAPLASVAPRIGNLAMLSHQDLLRRHRFIIGVGDIALRSRLARELDGDAATIVHPCAFVSPTAKLGAGVFIGPGAIVHTGASIGAHGTVNSGAVVEHDCALGDNTHVGPGAALGGQVRVGRDTLIGIGACVLPGVIIGAGCVVGAGAAVVSAVEDGALVVGVPARALER